MNRDYAARAVNALLAGTILASSPVLAQTAPAAPVPAAPVAAAPSVAPAPVHQGIVKSLRVEGSQRIEPETVLSYTKLRIGQPFNNETLDQAIKDLYASDLFADVAIAGAETGDIVVRIRENPIINRVIFEGNKNLKQDKIDKEVKLKPRQIFTRTAVREDVTRILELYRRQGRFAATVDPKMVSLDQNRVDVVFVVNEGPKSKVRQINIIGNHVFNDAKLRSQMATKESSLSHLLSSNTSYDQDRMAYDQQKLRQFYLTQGYADFRVTSAVAELSPDKRDFIITYVIEEGPRYHFGEVTVDSDIRDFDNKKLAAGLPFKAGDWYNAKQVEDSVDSLSSTAGLVGYAFTDVNPEFTPDHEKLTMSVNFHIAEAKRTYVERVDITGNTQTQDKVIRRELRLAEGDPFNSFQMKRSQDRINSLGFFQDKFELKQVQGSSPDRVVIQAPMQEKATGELQLSAGYSSLEQFIIQGSITQHNFRGKGQELRATADWSSYSKSVELGFTEPYLFNKNIAVGGDLFRRDYNSFDQLGDTRQTTYSQVSTGFQLRSGVPITEYWSLAGRYGLSFDDVGLSSQYYTNGQCDSLLAGRYLCDAIGNRVTSSVGASLIFDNLDSRLHPTRGSRLTISGDFAGLGGDVRYLRGRIEGAHYWNVGSGFIFSMSGEGGYIKSLQKDPGAGVDPVRITDRFFLGEPQIRGFDIRGVGPRVRRTPFTTDSNGNQILSTDKDSIYDDALGGRAYYLGHAEMEIPLGAGGRELGLRPSIFVDAGAVFGLRRPNLTVFPQAVNPKNGKLEYQAISEPIKDSAGRPIYLVPTPTDGSTDANAGLATTCSVGFSPSAGGPCTGTSVNTAEVNTISPFLEQYLGDTPKPRISVGFGVNWNSPFGPLRIDVAKALVSAPGDDKKLVTFNVGTQF